MSVALETRLDVKYAITNPDKLPADGAPSGGGGLQGSGVVRRHGTWLIARGPLPEGAVSRLDSSWKVLAWW
jgi:hypothetical protein